MLRARQPQKDEGKRGAQHSAIEKSGELTNKRQKAAGQTKGKKQQLAIFILVMKDSKFTTVGLG